jgi:hypothetical protein
MALTVVSVAAVTVALASSAGAAIHMTAFTSRVAPGSYAKLTVKVAPTARCTITVVCDTVVSHAKGLGAKRGGTITWRWRVGTNTHPDHWPVTVDCGKSGKLIRKLTVTA